MMAEDILYEMSRQIGEISGKLSEVGKFQNETNNALYRIINDHEARIKSVEGTRNQLFGIAAATGIGSTGILATLMKLFHTSP